MGRINVLKTYKLYIGGQFPRSESGRYTALKNRQGTLTANVSLASRKDLRNAVTAARGAFDGWWQRSAFNRGQILYRIAEMLEGRREEFITELKQQGFSAKVASQEVDVSIDRLVYYAGWCDKYQQVFSSVNPVASPHFNFSMCEPMGVVTAICSSDHPLTGLISVIAPVIAGGNTCVVLASEKFPLNAITFGEVLHTSDLPAGVVNILTGSIAELHEHLSSHMDVNATIYCGDDNEISRTIQQKCSLNVKRFFEWKKDWLSDNGQDPYLIMDAQEMKTTWHPVDRGISAGSKY
jgi:acyl-CoA reductase-like NAD-dependent aldehyde dehydrogenase